MQVLNKTNKLFIVVFSCLGLAVLGLQAPVIVKERNAQQDATTSSDLQSINSAIETKASADSKLPQKLSDLTLQDEVKTHLSKYEYKPNANGSDYELCAVFKTDTSKSKSKSSEFDDEGKSAHDNYYFHTSNYYSHKQGRVCFEGSTSSPNTSSYYDYDDIQPPSGSAGSGSGGSSSSSSIQERAKDAQITTDINNIHSKLEVYYNENSGYPSLAQLKDQTWRSTNLLGAGEDIYIGPNSESIGAGYNYTPTPASCHNSDDSFCDSYTLSAKLSTGTTYTKHSLN